jgi:hypothetical protein
MRYFSIQEANAFVPALSAAFHDIERLRKRVVELTAELVASGAQRDVPAEAVSDLPEPVKLRRKEINQALHSIRGVVRDLESHGIIVKELDGNVSFRSLRGTRPVYLSWRLGEDRVQRWHEAWTDDSAGQPVDRVFEAKKPLLN